MKNPLLNTHPVSSTAPFARPCRPARFSLMMENRRVFDGVVGQLPAWNPRYTPSFGAGASNLCVSDHNASALSFSAATCIDKCPKNGQVFLGRTSSIFPSSVTYM